ncbi:MAG: EthD domain-containing protein [Candidatus Brocadiia bacterium]|jgi:uncharacterized protein (TIGR02118 family)
MLKLIVAVKRRQGMSVEEFHNHWSTVHANLIKTTPVCRRYIRKYVQCHTVPEEYVSGDAPYDGTAEVWFDSVADKEAFFQHPEYLAKIRPDELLFADLEKTKFFVTREERILP